MYEDYVGGLSNRSRCLLSACECIHGRKSAQITACPDALKQIKQHCYTYKHGRLYGNTSTKYFALVV